MRLSVANLQDFIALRGPDGAQGLLDGYSCGPNPDIEAFARGRAVDFARKGIAQTHLVFADDAFGQPRLVGFFALANKVLAVPTAGLSNTRKRFVRRFGIEDSSSGVVSLAAPLIAQLGKNFRDGADTLVTGEALLDAACQKVAAVQRDLGGRLVYLECEDTPKLVAFYERNGFRRIDADRPGELLTMIKFL